MGKDGTAKVLFVDLSTGKMEMMSLLCRRYLMKRRRKCSRKVGRHLSHICAWSSSRVKLL